MKTKPLVSALNLLASFNRRGQVVGQSGTNLVQFQLAKIAKKLTDERTPMLR
jgi:hypothetical protein